MNKITQYGKVEVTENNLVVDGFRFESNEGRINADMIPILEWAIKRLLDELVYMVKWEYKHQEDIKNEATS